MKTKFFLFFFVFLVFSSSVFALKYKQYIVTFDNAFYSNGTSNTTLPILFANNTANCYLYQNYDWGYACFGKYNALSYSYTYINGVSIGNYYSDTTNKILNYTAQNILNSMVIKIHFNDGVYLDNNAKVSLRLNVSVNGTDKISPDFCFLVYNGSSSSNIFYEYRLVTEGAGYVEDKVCNYKQLLNFGSFFGSSNPTILNLNFTGITNTYLMNDLLIVLDKTSTDAMSTYIQYFDFTFGDANNSLPLFNVSLNSTDNIPCVNDTNTSTLSLPLYWEVYDAENDTILYGSKVQYGNFQTTDISFTKNYCFLGVCYNSVDDTHLKEFVYPINETCTVANYSTLPDNSKFYIENYDDIYSPSYVGEPMLKLQNSCVGSDKSLYLPMTYPSIRTEVTLKLFNYKPGQSFNLSLLDENLTPTRTLGFYVNSSNITLVYDSNGVLVGTYDSSTDFKVLGYQMYFNLDENDNFTQSVNFFSGYKFVYYNKTSNNSNRYIKIEHTSPDVPLYIDLIRYSGIPLQVNFSTTQPQTLDFTSIKFGYGYSFTYYVTDSVHTPNKYNSQNLFVTVMKCSDKISPLSPDYTTLGRALKNENLALCNAFNGIIKGFGFSACNIFLIIGLIFSLILAIIVVAIFLFMIPQIAYAMGLVAFSLGMFVTDSFLIDMTNSLKIISAVLFVLGIIGVIMGIIGSQETGVIKGGSDD